MYGALSHEKGVSYDFPLLLYMKDSRGNVVSPATVRRIELDSSLRPQDPSIIFSTSNE